MKITFPTLSPAPWSVDDNTIQCPGSRPGITRIVAQVYETNMEHGQPDHETADTRAIAATPQTLAALAECAKVIQHTGASAERRHAALNQAAQALLVAGATIED